MIFSHRVCSVRVHEHLRVVRGWSPHWEQVQSQCFALACFDLSAWTQAILTRSPTAGQKKKWPLITHLTVKLLFFLFLRQVADILTQVLHVPWFWELWQCQAQLKMVAKFTPRFVRSVASKIATANSWVLSRLLSPDEFFLLFPSFSTKDTKGNETSMAHHGVHIKWWHFAAKIILQGNRPIAFSAIWRPKWQDVLVIRNHGWMRCSKITSNHKHTTIQLRTRSWVGKWSTNVSSRSGADGGWSRDDYPHEGPFKGGCWGS